MRLHPQPSVEAEAIQGVVGPGEGRDLTWYRVILRTGWKRQIRRMFAAIGDPVARLVRVRVGTLRLDLPAGQARLLTPAEVRRLAAARPPDRGRRSRNPGVRRDGNPA